MQVSTLEIIERSLSHTMQQHEPSISENWNWIKWWVLLRICFMDSDFSNCHWQNMLYQQVSMVNCVTNAYRCQDVIMGTVIRALSATAIKAGMVCSVEMVGIIWTLTLGRSVSYRLYVPSESLKLRRLSEKSLNHDFIIKIKITFIVYLV